MDSIAKINKTDFDSSSGLLTIQIHTSGTRFSCGSESKRYTFINSAPLFEGINLILQNCQDAVNAINNNGEFSSLREENKILRETIKNIRAFEDGERVFINGLTYQKGINENSFYTAIK